MFCLLDLSEICHLLKHKSNGRQFQVCLCVALMLKIFTRQPSSQRPSAQSAALSPLPSSASLQLSLPHAAPRPTNPRPFEICSISPSFCSRTTCSSSSLAEWNETVELAGEEEPEPTEPASSSSSSESS